MSEERVNGVDATLDAAVAAAAPLVEEAAVKEVKQVVKTGHIPVDLHVTHEVALRVERAALQDVGEFLLGFAATFVVLARPALDAGHLTVSKGVLVAAATSGAAQAAKKMVPTLLRQGRAVAGWLRG